MIRLLGALFIYWLNIIIAALLGVEFPEGLPAAGGAIILGVYVLTDKEFA